MTMTLSERQATRATRANRTRQERAERRLDEIVKAAGIPDEYDRRDRDGNLAVETAFATCYQLVDSEAERDAVVAAFMVWQRDEQSERGIVRDLSSETVNVLKANNPAWLDEGGAA